MLANEDKYLKNCDSLFWKHEIYENCGVPQSWHILWEISESIYFFYN
jgi:hypothetical protein